MTHLRLVNFEILTAYFYYKIVTLKLIEEKSQCRNRMSPEAHVPADIAVETRAKNCSKSL